MPADDQLPSASIANLKQRAKLVSATRVYFESAGYWEVETPILSQEMVLDSWIDPFVVLDGTEQGSAETRYFLQTSPEAHMKRLLAAGSGPIFQFSQVFRKGEIGPRHNPEFMMLEWYKPLDELPDQIQLVENFVRSFFAEAARLRILATNRSGEPLSRPTHGKLLPSAPFERLTYNAAFERYLGLSALEAPTSELVRKAGTLDIAPPVLDPDDRDGWLNFLLGAAIEPMLGLERPVFLMDYPASQAALATTRALYPAGPEVANRFELYIDGVELCNGYHELTDPVELAHRAAIQTRLREAAGLPALKPPQRLMAAMSRDFPPCTGVALGFDRLVMLALGANQISEVISFEWDRA
ncbi:MAG: EF-P lysine aminoacylase GenX [Planctomyces sp.]|nr:EF-P lysine aminoacylase GenX [Planctomyces sp.]